jgi:predicted transcriptional regulator
MMNRKQRRESKKSSILPVSTEVQKRAYNKYKVSKYLLNNAFIAYDKSEVQEQMLRTNVAIVVGGGLKINEAKRAELQYATNMMNNLYRFDLMK